MSITEKLYSIFGVIFGIGLVLLIYLVPATRELAVLLPLSFIGLLVNIGLIFVVLKDLFTREGVDKNRKIIWTMAMLICWPTIVVYLFAHGFEAHPQNPK